MGDDAAEFDRTSTEDLRDRAVELARQRWDLRFFWRLLGLVPAAEAAAGNDRASEASVAQLSGFVYEALSVETDPGVQEALRPVYVQYLLDHGEEEGDTGPGTGDTGTSADPGGTAPGGARPGGADGDGPS
ncbi:hypothetical protein [Nocardiopsis sp. CA-288880]|uniref:hypothetical protein n=1 Tax=Nocardiopsis sp. CA-288880 TaxID=3239995 RepID=UPI003D962F86